MDQTDGVLLLIQVLGVGGHETLFLGETTHQLGKALQVVFLVLMQSDSLLPSVTLVGRYTVQQHSQMPVLSRHALQQFPVQRARRVFLQLQVLPLLIDCLQLCLRLSDDLDLQHHLFVNLLGTLGLLS